MPALPTLLTFLIALMALELTPGPDMMLVLARGIGQGRRVALLTVVGMVFVAGVAQVGLLVLGVASLLTAHPNGLRLLQWGGAAYMLYLGARMIWASVGDPEKKRHTAAYVSDWSAVKDGTINRLTNPKPALFMFAFLPQFVDSAVGPVWLQLAILGTIQNLAGILSLGSVAMASGTFGVLLHRWPRFLAWQHRFTGLVMVGLGLRLLVAGGTGSAPRH